MVEFSKNKWKYSTVGLLVILAFSFSIPQAFGHITNNTQHMLQHIFNFVNGVEAKTNNLPTDPADQSLIDAQFDEIQTSLDGISVEGCSQKSVRMDFLVNPPDSNEEEDADLVDILPAVVDKTYSGYITLDFNVPSGNFIGLFCFTNENLGFFIPLDNSSPTSPTVNTQFACERLQVVGTESEDGIDADPVRVIGLAQYTESTDITEIAG